MKHPFLSILPVLLVLTLSATSYGHEGYYLLTTRLPPWSIDRDTGVFVDILKEVERRSDCSADVELLPWGRVQDMAEHGAKIVLFPLTRIPSREEGYRWIFHVAHVKFAFCSNEDIPLDLESAREYTVSVHAHTPGEVFLKNNGFTKLNPMKIGVGTIPQLFMSGRAKVWFGELHLIAYGAQGTPMEGKLHCGPVVLKEELYIAGSKSLPTEVVERYQKHLQDMKKEGVIQEILDRYLSEISYLTEPQ